MNTQEALKIYSAAPLTGYKVMRYLDGKAVSSADSRMQFPLTQGQHLEFTGNGLYLTLDKQYALTYYSGLHDQEVLLTFSFDPQDIVTGNLTDRETEFSVSQATMIESTLLEPEE